MILGFALLALVLIYLFQRVSYAEMLNSILPQALEIKNANAEIILHATMARNGGDMVNMNMESASLLTKAGITVSIETGYEGYVPKTRILLFEAAQAMVFGLGFDDALKAITLNPARLLGIADKVGSIEKGKDADLVLFNGDPFEYLSKVCGVMIDGVMVKEDCR